MSAFESAPVHCLNPRPSLKRRSPGYVGTHAILNEGHGKLLIYSIKYPSDVPAVNIIENLVCLRLGFMSKGQILPYPGDKMILEDAFDDLM